MVPSHLARLASGWALTDRAHRAFRPLPSTVDIATIGRHHAAGDLASLAGEPIAAGELLAPVTPTKIVCVGLNYRLHAEEQGKPLPPEPLLFMKPTTALVDPNGTVILPAASELVHHEGELAVVIGCRAKNVDRAEAMDHVLGLTCFNDVSARDIQRREKRYTRAKGYDTFAPIGPTIALGLDPHGLQLELRVNGQTRQSSTTDDMIFGVPEIVAFVSHIMTLVPGDVIATGTPSGVGPLAHGDQVSVTIEDIGTLNHSVVRQDATGNHA